VELVDTFGGREALTASIAEVTARLPALACSRSSSACAGWWAGRGAPGSARSGPPRAGRRFGRTPVPYARPGQPGTVGCSTASTSASVRRYVPDWYAGFRTISENARRLG